MVALSNSLPSISSSARGAAIRDYLEVAGITAEPSGAGTATVGLWRSGRTQWIIKVVSLSRVRHFGAVIARGRHKGYRLTLAAPTACAVNFVAVHKNARGRGLLAWINKRRGMQQVFEGALPEGYQAWCSDKHWAARVLSDPSACDALKALMSMHFTDRALGYPSIRVARGQILLRRRMRRRHDLSHLPAYLRAATTLRHRMASAPEPRRPVAAGLWAQFAKRSPMLARCALMTSALLIPTSLLVGLWILVVG